jgi:peptidoglycan/xylan/chitin deacetylase (PgdA/CDA1 family)
MTKDVLKPGMDNPYYDHAPLAQRKLLDWPNGARTAVITLVHLEYWELTAGEDAYRDPRFVGEYGSFDPDYRTWTQRDYGARVGLFRLLDVLDKHKLKLTAPTNSEALTRYPQAVAALRQRGAEFAGHGQSANRMITSRMDDAAETQFIAASLDAVRGATGAAPRGWVGQDYGESARTPALLAAAGVDYVLDWPNDDQPYLLKTSPPLLSIPSQPEWDDVQQLWLRRMSMQRFEEMLVEAFTVLNGEGGRVFVLSLHPWLIGMAHRIRYLDSALTQILRQDGVWSATAADVAAHARKALA